MTVFAPPAAPPSTRQGPAIVLLLVAAFLVVLNETAMGVAIPHIVDGFGVSADAPGGLADSMGVGFRIGGFISIAGIALALFLGKPAVRAAGSSLPGEAESNEHAQSGVSA